MWTTLSQMKTRNRWNSINVHMLYCFFFFFTACHQNASIMDRNKSLTSSNRLVKYFWFFSFSLVSLTTSYFPADHVFLPRLHEPMIGGTPLPMTLVAVQTPLLPDITPQSCCYGPHASSAAKTRAKCHCAWVCRWWDTYITPQAC